jgi:thiamine biosynthesis lipoprotein
MILEPAPPRAALAALVLLASAAAAEPLRMAGRAFDRRVEIEVRDLGRADAERAVVDAFRAVESARADLRAIESTARPGAPLRLDGAQAELVRRALGVCAWSEGAVGPLGGELFRLWGLRSPVTSFPVPDEIERAAASAGCARAELDAGGTLALAAGTALDFFPFELGWAVDRAAGTLAAAGASNFWISLGEVVRAAGGGPDGRGWAYSPPLVAGQLEPLAPFALRDRSLALLRPGDRPLRVAGESFAPYFDLRRGRPGGGEAIAAVIVVAELAVDAQAVGYAMFARGPREGTMLVGALTPRPSIRWLLGSGQSAPVLADVNWGVVVRP